MTTLNLTALELLTSNAAAQPVQEVAPGENATERFNAAMERATAAGAVDPAQAAQSVQPSSESPAADDRTLKALDLPGAASERAGGDMILEGLSKLRGVFDREIVDVGKLTQSKDVDMQTLMAMQVEVVNFSLLVDVTSKLTGKSTQSFDTLMKGQ